MQRRRGRDRAALAVAARQLAERGIAAVSVEEPIAKADVSRTAFCGLLSSKYSLLEGILNPIFGLATRRIREHPALQGALLDPAAAALFRDALRGLRLRAH
jgi:AcrR family transcriptional regulator